MILQENREDCMCQYILIRHLKFIKDSYYRHGMINHMEKKFARVVLLLRIGVAFAFLYAAIASFVEPQVWVGYLPAFMLNLISGSILLPAFSIVEIIVALWLLSGKALFYSGMISALMMAGIIVFNFGALDIDFRDITILFASIALMVAG